MRLKHNWSGNSTEVFPVPTVYNDLIPDIAPQGDKYHVTTTFLNTLYKLTRFNYIHYSCSSVGAWNSVFTSDAVNNAAVEVFKYFIGETDTRPSFCGTTNYNIDCRDIQDSKWSAEGVPFEERYYNKPITRTDGIMLTQTPASNNFGCLVQPGAYIMNDEYAVWCN